MPKILLIEDDADLQFLLRDNFGAEGYETEVAGTGAEGTRLAIAGGFDLIILDLMLPDVPGIEVCKRIRARNETTPIVILTAKGEEIDKVVGLEVGADDYITKPFGMRELLARIKAALRRAERAVDKAVSDCQIGTAKVDFVRRQVIWGKNKASLTRCENDLLRLLASRRGEAVTRQHILAEVWSTEMQSGNRTVDNYITRLRAKLERDPAHPEHILTVHGTGYRLV